MPNYENITAPISLVGYGRSGTSLMSRTFRQHKAIDEVGETANAIFTPFRSVDEIKGLTRFDDTKSLRAGGDITRYTFLRLYPSQKPDWMQKPIGLPKVFWQFGYQAVPAFCDWYWAAFYEAFPDSRTFTIVRHPYDVFISAKKYWGFEEAGIWRTQAALLKLLSSPAAKFRIAVRYEDLVTDAETAMKAICKAVDLEFDPAMLRAFDQLHAPNTGRFFGTAEELDRKKQEQFSHAAQWDAEIGQKDLAAEALAQYEQTLQDLGI